MFNLDKLYLYNYFFENLNRAETWPNEEKGDRSEGMQPAEGRQVWWLHTVITCILNQITEKLFIPLVGALEAV